MVKLGLPMTLGKAIRELEGASLFLGSDSGMANVCSSVGTTAIIYCPPRHATCVFEPGIPRNVLAVARTPGELASMAAAYMGSCTFF